MNKQCVKCKEVKEITQFAKNKNCADGYLTTCKNCAKIYRQQNAERRRLSALALRRTNGVSPKVVFETEQERSAAHAQACRRWQQQNQTEFAKYQKLYRDATKDHLCSMIKQWRCDNKGRINAWTAKRRAAIAQATPSWVNYEDIVAIYDQAQELSNMTNIPHHVDHYYPIHGRTVCGLHIAENLQVISMQENLDKGNKHPDDFYQGA